jgi:hypothetical protein
MAFQPPLTRTVTFTSDGVVLTKTIVPSGFNSVEDIAESLAEETGLPSAGRESPSATASDASATASDSSSPTNAGSQTSGGFITSTIASTGQSNAQPEQTSSSSGVASGSNGESPTQSTRDSCNSISCSPGLQAAIAVPVVVVTLLAIALLFCCLRRRRRRDRSSSPISEKRSRPKKKWSRHLRVFSFDAELLMGGRFSSSNSLRSRETGSTRSHPRSAHAGTPSIHTVEEEVAPPYRDAVTHTQPPSTIPMAAGMTSGTSDPFPRSESTFTAPPPYPTSGSNLAAAAGGISRNTSRASTTNQIATPVSARSINDPFRNDPTSPVSPIERDNHTSPFTDPSEEPHSPSSLRAPFLGRSSRQRDVFDDARSDISSNVEVASIREAQVGRSLSVRQGRMVDGRGGS